MTLRVPFRPAGVVSAPQDASAFAGNFYIPNVSEGAGGRMLSMEIPKETDFSLAISFIGTHYVLLPL